MFDEAIPASYEMRLLLATTVTISVEGSMPICGTGYLRLDHDDLSSDGFLNRNREAIDDAQIDSQKSWHAPVES